MTTIKAIVWDMDGLLIDSEPVWNDARKRMAKANGVDWTQDDHFNVMGVSTKEWTDYMIKRIGLTMPPADVETAVINEMIAMYQEGIPFRPFAVDKIKWAASKYPSCIASGSPRQLIDIVSNDPRVAPFMQFTIAADEVGKGKPDPSVYLEAAQRLGIPPENCICLEDSPNGVLSGYRAGMKVINIPDPEMPLTAEQAKFAHLVLNHLGEFNEEAIAALEQSLE
ncbi:MAG: HAD family phosphatase [Chloroflexota bacterium]